MHENLLTDTEASIYLGITKELLYAYIRNAPKKALNHDQKLISYEVDGKNMFNKTDLDAFNFYLKEPWSNSGDKRPEIPTYIQEYLKTEIGGKCPITGKGYPLENAHIEDYATSKNHHHHNLIRIAKDEHTKYDSGVLSKENLIKTKNDLIESLRSKMSIKTLRTKIVTYLPNIDRQTIKGRDNEIMEIYKSVVDNRKVTIINGFGGIGKTSLAQLYAKLYCHNYDYFFWLDFPDVSENSTGREVLMTGLANNFLILDFLGVIPYGNISLENLFDLVLNKLIKLPGKKLFIFDNVPKAINEFSFLFPENNELNILGTSRGPIDGFININIDTLSIYDAVELFYCYYKLENNDKIVLQILSLIGFHTLAIELLAKLAEKRQISLNILYQLISSEGLNMSVEAKIITTHDKTRKPTLPFNYLCEIFNILNLSDGQIALLRNFSVIGNVHLSFTQLESLLADSSNSNNLFHELTELQELGWIFNINNQYFSHQLVCEVLKYKLKPTYELCQTLIDRISTHIEKSSNDINSYIQRTYIQIGENIVNSIILLNDVKFHFKLCIARHYGFTGNYEKYNLWYSELKKNELNPDILKFIEINNGNILLSQGKCKEAIQTLLECRSLFNDEIIKAQIDGTIAHAYSELGNYSKANEIFAVTYKKLENDPNLSESEFAVFTNNYAQVLNGLGNSRKALEYSKKALKLREKLLDKNHPLLAQSYNNVGVDYEYLGQLSNALQFHLKALHIRIAYGDENADLAESYHNLASVLFQENKFSESREYFKKAIAIREIVFPNGSPSLMLSYICYASLLLKIEKTEAVIYYKKAIEMSENFDLENNQNSAYWYMGYSIALFENGNKNESLIYINLAIKMFIKFKIDGIKSAQNIKYMILSNSQKLVKKIGRNEPCSCGSGKKFKKCCYSN